MLELLPSFVSCHFCGTENPAGYGIRYRVDTTQGLVRGEVDPPETSCGYPGILHGGLQSALLDDVMWWAAAYAGASSSVTLSMTTHFEHSARLGAPFTLESRVTGRDGRKINAEARMVDGDGETVSRGEGLYLFLNRDEFEDKMLTLLDFSGCSEPIRRHFVEGQGNS